MDLPYGGSWVDSTLGSLAAHRELEIAVAWPHRNAATLRRLSVAGVQYYEVPDPGWLLSGNGALRKITNRLEPFLGQTRDRRAVAECAAVAADYGPDLVQVFGTEKCYGLVAPLVRPPTVVWIQGLLDVYQHHYFGSFSPAKALRGPGVALGYLRMKAEANRERDIFGRTRYFIGRTRWDRAHQLRLQPTGRYYDVQECLRPEFYAAPAWTLAGSRKLSVYTTTSPAPWKGTDVVLRAVALLQRSFPAIHLRVAGVSPADSGVGKSLARLASQLGITDNVTFLGVVGAAEIVEELNCARVFALPSHIENSPNSLAEAQVVGTPVVSAFAGGVPDMVTDGETGLLFQAGDSSVLALQIARLFTDQRLARDLSECARSVARQRHSPDKIAGSLVAAYRDILADDHQEGMR